MIEQDLEALVLAYFGDERTMLPKADPEAARAAARERGVSLVEFFTLLPQFDLLASWSFEGRSREDGAAVLRQGLREKWPILSARAAERIVNAISYSYR